jgi:hypothetical protein
MKLIHNSETNEVIERPFTAEEENQILADVERAKAVDSARKANVAAQTALLEKLGLTEEEAKLLLA